MFSIFLSKPKFSLKHKLNYSNHKRNITRMALPFGNKLDSVNTVYFSDLITKLKSNDINDIYIKPLKNQLFYMETNGTKHVTQYNDSNEFWKLLMDSNANILIDNQPQLSISNIFVTFFMFVLTISLIRNLLMSRSTHSIKKQNNIVNNTSFNDVEGIDNAKFELEEIVNFLQNSEKYTSAGAKIPKGALLIGPPGTGKTLLARAVANEAKVPFIQCSGSSFIEMFVGMGAKRVRDVFENARKNQPCILFIDEIDAIGKARSSNPMSNNSEYDQTINQLLTEMDGFDVNSQVIVLGATNRLDILDEALLRPGRFDRKINIELPDSKGREKILKVHSKNKQFDESVNLKYVANQTNGFSGADLENFINECAISAVREGNGKINSSIIEDVYQRLIVGTKSNKTYSSNFKKRIAYHEAGHALIGVIMPNFDVLRKVSIISRGSACGVTFFQPKSDSNVLPTKQYMESYIKMLLAGHAVEEFIYGENNVSTGASNDFQNVYNIARDMITKYGFNDFIGKIGLNEQYLSNDMKYDIDNEIRKYINNQYKFTLNLITINKDKIEKIKEELLKYEIIDGTIVYDIVENSI